MSSNKYQGSNVSKDPREVKSLVPASPRAPGFSNDDEWISFKGQVERALAQGMIPAGVETPEKALVIALKGRELGLDPIYALSQLYVVHGKVGMQSEVMRALVYRRYPGARMEYITPAEKRHQEATFLFQRPGGAPQYFTFTIEDAKATGVVVSDKMGRDGFRAIPKKPTWDTARPDMLMARATGKGVRMVFPECVMGAGYTREELEAIVETGDAAVAESIEQRFQPKEVSAHGASDAESLPPAQVFPSTVPPASAVECAPLDRFEGPELEVVPERMDPALEREQMRLANAPVRHPAPEVSPQAAKPGNTVPAHNVPRGTPEAQLATPGDYIPKIGRFIGKPLYVIGLTKLREYVQLQLEPQLNKTPDDPGLLELVAAVKAYLAAGV